MTARYFIDTNILLSYWAAAILAAAQMLKCEILYTEDLNDGQLFDGVQVRNPFTLAE